MSKSGEYCAILLLLAGFQGCAGGAPVDYKKQLQSQQFGDIAKQQESRTEQVYNEVADWIGKTGLPEEFERELPRHLRKQFGQQVGERDALKARDLKYLGVHPVDQTMVHYWELPTGMPKRYAYITVYHDGSICFDTGNSPMPL